MINMKKFFGGMNENIFPECSQKGVYLCINK